MCSMFESFQKKSSHIADPLILPANDSQWRANWEYLKQNRKRQKGQGGQDSLFLCIPLFIIWRLRLIGWDDE